MQRMGAGPGAMLLEAVASFWMAVQELLSRSTGRRALP
jgi:hypothetical protein